jgi:subtilisin-like proprotein convertase family protein
MQHDSSLGRCSAGFAAMALVMSLSAVAYAAIPSVTQIEGALAATGGGPVSDGAYAMTFLLYKDAQGGAAVWTEGPIDVAVVSGSFSHDLGAITPLTQDVLKALAGQGFLALKVGQDPELTRKPLRSASFALRTAVAEGLDCSGCLTAAQLDAGVLQPYAKTATLAKVATSGKFSDLEGGPDLSAYAKLASLATVASTGAYADLEGAPDTSVFAKAADLSKVATSGKYADLTDTATLPKLGATCGTGLVIKGLKADGSYECVQSMDPTGLPADGIDELSNGLIWNQFTDVFAAQTKLAIPDNNPIGGFSEIDVGDVGLAQKLTVSLELTNSDVTNVQVSLFDSANQQYVLWNKGGKKGDGIKTAYPDPTKTISGDLSYWVGKNPKGKWRLQVIDTAFLNNTTDGEVVAWSINLQTLSNKKIRIAGDLIVEGTLTNTGLAQQIASGVPKPATFRWNTFHAHINGATWNFGDDAALHMGVNPSSWSGGAYAFNVSADKNLQRIFFVNKGSSYGNGAMIHSEYYSMYNDGNIGKHLAVLFRIKNTSGVNKDWSPTFHFTAYGGWSEYTSVSVNGQNSWTYTSNCYSNTTAQPTLTIPGSQPVSTVIWFVSSSPPWTPRGSRGYRELALAFKAGAMTLPAGLAFVDDLDTATGNWTQ